MQGSDRVTEFVRKLESGHTTFQRFATALERLLHNLLPPTVHLHSVSARVKDPASLRAKASRIPARYRSFDEITDIVGLRVITLFSNDVDAVADMVQREFDVDPTNSVDKGATLAHDRFGYVSQHFVVSLSESRLQLTEYKPFASLKAEIQIRSVLQHAWAEIEHDLGYKPSVEVPTVARRRFARLAALLEVADSEFVGLRQSLATYEKAIATRDLVEGDSVAIDTVSLRVFGRQSQSLREVGELFQARSGRQYLASDLITAVKVQVDYLAAAGISSLQQLEASLKRHRELLVSYLVETWPQALRPSDIITIHAHLVLALRSPSPKDFFDQLVTLGHHGPTIRDISLKLWGFVR